MIVIKIIIDTTLIGNNFKLKSFIFHVQAIKLNSHWKSLLVYPFHQTWTKLANCHLLSSLLHCYLRQKKIKSQTSSLRHKYLHVDGTYLLLMKKLWDLTELRRGREEFSCNYSIPSFSYLLELGLLQYRGCGQAVEQDWVHQLVFLPISRSLGKVISTRR